MWSNESGFKGKRDNEKIGFALRNLEETRDELQIHFLPAWGIGSQP